MQKAVERKDVIRYVTEACFLFLILIYLGVFCYLNVAKLAEHADSDTASEVLLAREIWEEKDISPNNWLSSTERKLISPSTVGALFYGCGIPMNLAMGLACILCGGVLIASFVYLLKVSGMRNTGILTACLLLLCLPVNGIEVQDSILPFFAYLMFLFAGYYTPYVVVMLIALATYLRLRRGERNAFIVVTGGFATALSLALGASGLHSFQVATAPLILLELLCLYQETDRFTKKISRKRWTAGVYVVLLLLCNFLGLCYPSSVSQPMVMLNGAQVAKRVFSEVPGAVLKCMGIEGGSALMSFGGLMQICVYVFAGLTIYAFVFWRKHRSMVKEEVLCTINFFLLSLLFTVFAVSVSAIAPYHYYFFAVIFPMAVAVGYLADVLHDRYRVLWLALSVFICGYAIANLAYTYVPAAVSDSRQKEVKEVADYLEEHDISYGYAQYWNANRLTIVSEGKVTMGNVYDMGNLTMYWWLTNSKWYVPDLPEDMITAYVVTPDEEARFLAGVGERASMEKVFENSRFKVYVSDKNLVGR